MNHCGQRLDRPVVHGDHGNDVLGEHVDGITRRSHRLQLSGDHASSCDGGRHQVSTMGGENDAARDRAHLVTGTTYALHTRCDAGRGADLYHHVDRSHVDAQLEAGRRHHG